MTTSHSSADRAGFSSTCPGGPVRSGGGLYKSISIVTLVMMLFGGFAFMPMAASAAPTDVTADLNVRSEPISNAATLNAIPKGAVNSQIGPSLVDLLVAVLLDIRAIAQNVNSAAEVPAAPVSGNEGGIVGIIYAAADAYGQPREDMLRVARCESNLNPNAVNASSQASGLFQFLPSTWATTPYADQDIFDPVANANAAAWMWDNGRRNEWVCQ